MGGVGCGVVVGGVGGGVVVGVVKEFEFSSQ